MFSISKCLNFELDPRGVSIFKTCLKSKLSELSRGGDKHNYECFPRFLHFSFFFTLTSKMDIGILEQCFQVFLWNLNCRGAKLAATWQPSCQKPLKNQALAKSCLILLHFATLGSILDSQLS